MKQHPKYNPAIHHRRSIRLQGYDYSQEGLYFVTMCCQDRLCLFGEIKERGLTSEMMLNELGKITKECWLSIPRHFPNVKLHEYIIMPNHVHGIIEITEQTAGANQYSPDNEGEETNQHSPNNETIVRAKDFSP